MAQRPPVVDKSRIQGFGSNGPGPEPSTPSGIFSRVSVAPAVQSAVDAVALSVGDAVERTTDAITGSFDSIGGWINNSLIGNAPSSPTSGGRGTDETEDDILVAGPSEDKGKQKESWGTAEQVVLELCAIRGTRVVPTVSQLDYFCDRVSGLRLGDVIKAIHGQLTYSAGDTQWQPRLRVLYGLQAIHENGMDTIFTKILQEVGELVTSHVNIAECAEIAQKVLDLRSIPAIPPAGPEDVARRRRLRRRQESAADAKIETSLLQLDDPPPQSVDNLSQVVPSGGGEAKDLLDSGIDIGNYPAVSSSASVTPAGRATCPANAFHSFASFPPTNGSKSAVLPSAPLRSASDLPFDLLDVHSGKFGEPTLAGFGAPAVTHQSESVGSYAMPSERQKRFSALATSLHKDHECSFEKSDHFGFVNDLFEKKS